MRIINIKKLNNFFFIEVAPDFAKKFADSFILNTLEFRNYFQQFIAGMFIYI